MNWSDIERKLNDTVTRNEFITLRSNVDRMECSVREISAAIDGLCTALEAAKEIIDILKASTPPSA